MSPQGRNMAVSVHQEEDMNWDKSEEIFRRAQELIPGGVNSPVRAFGAVGRHPFIVERAKGAWLYDVDGNRYLDYVCSWGPGILGHAHPQVVEAVQNAGDRKEYPDNIFGYGIPDIWKAYQTALKKKP